MYPSIACIVGAIHCIGRLRAPTAEKEALEARIEYSYFLFKHIPHQRDETYYKRRPPQRDAKPCRK